MNENYNTPNSGCCGRNFPTAPENKCNYNSCCMNEYAYKQKACIRNKQPDCEAQAVIPSITVETVDGITNLANCLVHVTSTNTTYYVDDKHRIMITWAGPVNIPGYDMEGNPEKFKGQIVTDTEAGIAVIYDKNGIGYTFGIQEGLDVQEEINNKLDQMLEDGVLEEIIAQFLQSTAIWCFDTVSDLKLATNLISGSYAQTLGFHTINDGGGAIYKISNTGTANEMDVIAVGSLYAHLIAEEELTPEQFGAYGDGTHDDAPSIRGALSYIATKNGGVLQLNEKVYSIGSLANPDETVTTFFVIPNNLTMCGKGTLKVADSFGDYDCIFKYTSALDKVTFRDFTIDDNTTGNPIIGTTGGSEGHHRTGFRLISYATKEIIIDNITFNDCVGTWQVITERAIKGTLSNITINFNGEDTINYDQTSIYFGCLYGSVYGCKLNGNGNGNTAFELHGIDNTLYNNYVNDYNSGVFVTNQNIVNENIDRLEVYSNTLIVKRRGVESWFTEDNLETKLVSIHDNLITVTNTTLTTDVLGIGTYGISGNNSSIKNYLVTNNTVKTNNSYAVPFRFHYSQSTNTFTINNLMVKNNNVSGVMQNVIRMESQADNTLKILSTVIDHNKFVVEGGTRVFNVITHQGFDYIYFTNNIIESSSITQIYKLFGTNITCKSFIENNKCNKAIIATDIAGGDNHTGIVVKHQNATLNSGTTYNALPANIADGSEIISGKYHCIKENGKWIVNCSSQAMPTHQWFGKGSVINLTNDSNIMAIAKNNGYTADHNADTGDHHVGDWVYWTNTSAVWYCKADNTYTDNPANHTDSFNYMGTLSSFYTISAS